MTKPALSRVLASALLASLAVGFAACGPSAKELAERARQEQIRQERLAQERAEAQAAENARRHKLAVDVDAGDRAMRAGRGQQAIEHYMKALRENAQGTEKDWLREKVVRVAAAMPEPPEIPEDARRYLVQSQYLAKQGAAPAEIEQVLRQGVEAAPWWVDGYYNLALLQAGDNRFNDAIANLKLFIAGSPKGERADAAQDKIYEFEMAQKQADKVAGLAGRWTRPSSDWGMTLNLDGGKLHGVFDDGVRFTATLRNGQIDGTVESASRSADWNCTIPGQNHPVSGRLSSDGTTIELEYVWSTYEAHGHPEFNGRPWVMRCLLCTDVCDGANITSTNNVQLRLVKRG